MRQPSILDPRSRSFAACGSLVVAVSTGCVIPKYVGNGFDEDGGSIGDTDAEALPPCPGVGLGATPVGGACSANAECVSAVCTIFTDVPLGLAGVCDVPASDCSMRITATTRDIVSRQPKAAIEVRIATMSGLATDPMSATPVVSLLSDPSGRIDVVTPGPPDALVGLVALAEGFDFELTATTIAVPLEEDPSSYGVANDVHDVWVVPSEAVAAWSEELSLDGSIPVDALPLVEVGGVVGLVRDAAGAPIAGATVTPTPQGSGMVVRYLGEDGSFDADATGELGLFLILAPASDHELEVLLDGTLIGRGRVLSAHGVVVAFVITAPLDSSG